MEITDNFQFQVNELVIKYIVGSANDEERNIVLAWLNESVDNQKLFDELKDYYQLTKVIQKPSGYSIEDGWNRVRARYYQNRYLSEIQNKRNKNAFLRYILPVAAAIVIAFMLGFFVNNFLSVKNQPKTVAAFNEINVPLGAKAQVTLSDGSKVWLNAGSKLRYPVNFMQGSREVYLEGEAFFDVTKVNHKLFVVRTTKLNIKVYGTQFNVKSYPEEDLIQTTLVKGSVAIEPINDSEKKIIYLKPNQSATYYKSEIPVLKDNNTVQHKNIRAKTITPKSTEPTDNIVIAPKVDPIPITSWKDTRWVIVGEDLGHLAVKLERRYNVRISFVDESLKNYKFSGTLAEETFEQVLKIIKLSAPVKYSIDGNHIIFSEDLQYKKNYDKLISKQATN
jgi:ferric-dicitrate binding protein FerR (iron transport regulator)